MIYEHLIYKILRNVTFVDLDNSLVMKAHNLLVFVHIILHEGTLLMSINVPFLY